MQYPLAMYPTNRLRELRKAAKLSQAQLANLSGLTQSSISQFENDKLPLSTDHMRIFARILRCTPADLLGDEDNPGRLSPEEMALIQRYRAANTVERGIFQRTAEAIVPYRNEENDNDRAA
jgi:transcriptional regulator with XRE-family HTH domain